MREVDDAVRQERMERFTRRFGWPVLALVLLILAGLGLWMYWSSERRAEAEQDAVALTLAIDRVEARRFEDAAKQAAPLTGSETAGYRVPAQLIAAGTALQQGDLARAAQLFDKVASDDDAPGPYRDLAAIRAVSLRFDEMQPSQVIARLEPIANPGSPFFASAAELVAMAHVEAGDRQSAGALFAEVARDEDAPQTVRARARQLAGMLGTDAVGDAEEVLREIARGGARPQENGQ